MPIVVKVGGSLYDLPDLQKRLRQWLQANSSQAWVLFPGGGLTADAIRAYDRIHQLGEEAGHWLAIRALSVNAHFLGQLLPEAVLIPNLDHLAPIAILDPFPFFREEETQPDPLPHRWQVTSDSLALRVAQKLKAELVLLKSVTWNKPAAWQEAVDANVIDAYFPQLHRQNPRPVRIVNLRTIL